MSSSEVSDDDDVPELVVAGPKVPITIITGFLGEFGYFVNHD